MLLLGAPAAAARVFRTVCMYARPSAVLTAVPGAQPGRTTETETV
jgi:hypothetical protein